MCGGGGGGKKRKSRGAEGEEGERANERGEGKENGSESNYNTNNIDYLSDTNTKLDITIVAADCIPVTLPLPLTLPRLDNLQCLVLPPQLLQARLQLLNPMLIGR